jgi:hypothetical protein
MVRYYTQERAPHLVIELEGRVSGSAVRRAFADLPETLSALPANFVVRIAYPDVILFEAEAIGPLFYFITHLFDADPGLCVFVDGGQSPHPGLRTFIKQIGLTDQVAFVPTRKAADERIEAFRAAR